MTHPRDDARTKRRRARRQRAWEARRRPDFAQLMRACGMRPALMDRVRYAVAYAPWKPAVRNEFTT